MKTFIEPTQRNTAILIAASLLISVAIVISLFLASNEMVHRNNAFIRQFPPHVISVTDTFDIGYESYYLAGGTETQIYLANFTAPSHLLVISTISADTQHVAVSLMQARNVLFHNTALKVDSPDFYLYDGTVPVIFKGKVGDWKGRLKLMSPAYFNYLVPMGGMSFAVRSVDSESNGYVLGKIRLDPAHFEWSHNLLEKQIDGKFCVDGMLHYDKTTGDVVYLYYYRNEYIVADTNLNLRYRAKTIDTVSRAQIQVATIESDHSRTLAAPPLVVNKHSALYRNFLLVNSSLISKNEPQDVLKKLSVIDVYNVRKREYAFSFYVRNYGNKRIRSLQVYGNKLVLLFGSNVIVCILHPEFFEK